MCRSHIMEVVLDQEIWLHEIVLHNQGCRIIKVRLYFIPKIHVMPTKLPNTPSLKDFIDHLRSSTTVLYKMICSLKRIVPPHS